MKIVLIGATGTIGPGVRSRLTKLQRVQWQWLRLLNWGTHIEEQETLEISGICGP